jgi:hypothetical protein
MLLGGNGLSRETELNKPTEKEEWEWQGISFSAVSSNNLDFPLKEWGRVP